MTTTRKFKRGDMVFVCQVGFGCFGSWGKVTGYDPGMSSDNWYRVRCEDGTMVYHESWLNRGKPNTPDNPLSLLNVA